MGGEPRPPKEKRPINCSLHLLGYLLRCVTTLSSQSETNVCSVWGHLQGTYSSLLTLTSTPIIQAALSSIGLTDMLELPSLVSFPSSAWCYFKRSTWKLWRALQLAWITQQAIKKGEKICTCVQCCCDLMGSNQGQMIHNLLGCEC